MTPTLLAFAAGVLMLQLRPDVPAAAWCLAIPFLAAAGFRKPALAAPAALAAGFLWASGFAHLRLADRLAPGLEVRDLEVVGVVASLPALGERSIRFELETESAPAGVPSRILLSWYRSAAQEDQPALLQALPHPGERWRLTVRLKRPHGNANPHGFDYEGWLLERGIGATGYVRARAAPLLLGRRNTFLDRIERAREAVRDRFKATLGETPAAGILAALAVGDQRAISAEEWRLFNRTGVTHLMSISGLHVTMVSGLFAWLAGALWARLPRLALRVPARKIAAAAAIAAALGYALLAGFAVPAQRTFWMVTVVALALWAGSATSASRTLALALAVVLAFDPWAVLAPGFWLSFGAVGLIFYVMNENRQARPVQWLRVQWAITVGLAPAALFLFAQVSLVGPLANAVAIPLVSVVVTPLALAAAVLPLDLPAALASRLIELLLQFLEWCASLPAALWQQHAPPLWSVVLALAGVAWLLAPRGVPWRASGLALMLPAVALPAPAPGPGEAWITTLDVGQGLAVVVRTANRALLYDAGPQFGPDADGGERIVAPYLRASGIERLDALIVTHDDADHAGGAASVLGGFEVDELLSSLPEAHPLLALGRAPRSCRRGMRWAWDGVAFEFLHPAPGLAARRANDRSCVLKVTAQGKSMLLTGDVELESERLLLAQQPGSLKSDVLLVPHHGSRTSSSAPFLAAVGAQAAVIAAGYRNRFGHPGAEVLERYAAAGTRVVRTDRDGAVTVRLRAEGASVQAERGARRRYWQARG
jgi:competence protein ComEC